MNRKSIRIAGVFLLAAATRGAGDGRVNLLPKLRPGQTVTYLIRFQSDKTVKTESKVVTLLGRNTAQLDAHGLLRVEILDVQQAKDNATIRARGQFLTQDFGVSVKGLEEKKPVESIQPVDPQGKGIEF